MRISALFFFWSYCVIVCCKSDTVIYLRNDGRTNLPILKFQLTEYSSYIYQWHILVRVMNLSLHDMHMTDDCACVATKVNYLRIAQRSLGRNISLELYTASKTKDN